MAIIISHYNTFCFLIFILIQSHFHTTEANTSHPRPIDEPNFDQNQNRNVRVRRQYYVCPPEFKRISSNCYYFSQQMATWRDAHYECKDRHSQLAIIQTPAEDKKLRGQLNEPSLTPLEWWIGGIYDWEQMKWKWGASGRKLEYHGFSRMGPENKEKLKWHCIILDPTMRYKWSARSCVLGKHFICQKKVARVNSRGLEKLRRKYNNTLNEIPAPYHEKKPRKPKKPRKHENLSNSDDKQQHNLHSGDNNELNNAFALTNRNNTLVRRRNGRGRKRQRRKNRKNRKNRPIMLHIRNGTSFTAISSETGFQMDNEFGKRNRRNKSKESNSIEASSNNSIEELRNISVEDVQKMKEGKNTINPLHPRVIVEEHDFLDLKN